MLLWLWRRPAATALIRPLAWEPPYAAGAALEKAKSQKKKKKSLFQFLQADIFQLSLSHVCTIMPAPYESSGVRFRIKEIRY